MKKKHTNTDENKSLKTFFIYAIIVFLIVSISLTVRLFFIFGQSKFDGHNIDIAITHKGQVASIVGIDPERKSISVLEVAKEDTFINNLHDEIGIIPEAKIDAESDISAYSADKILTQTLLKTDGAKTDLTIIDKIRLLIFSKTAANINTQRESLNPSDDKVLNDKTVAKLFSDENIVSENRSIQIINATDISGLGQRLERIIVNKGGNVISVTSSRDKKKNSIIQYYGERNYTVRKLERVLKIQAVKTENKSIGEIAIIIGEDYRKSPESK